MNKRLFVIFVCVLVAACMFTFWRYRTTWIDDRLQNQRQQQLANEKPHWPHEINRTPLAPAE